MRLGNDAGARCSQIIIKRFWATFVATLVVFFFASASGQAATVTTDTTDYSPGATVVITGAGFAPFENVTLHVTHFDGTPSGGVGHDPWNVRTNFAGSFVSYWVVAYDDNLGEILLVTANGLSSSLTASVTFTDALTVNLDQLHNGTTTSSPEWANGNINTSNSCYAENDGVPFRFFVEGLAGGTHHNFTIQMEWTKGGIHAYDYSVNYDLTEAAGIASAGGPCGTISTSPPGDCNPTLSTYAFRVPTDSTNYATTPPSGFYPAGFTLSTPANLKFYNATIDSIGHYFFTGTASDRELNIPVYFKATDTASVGFYWAGHMAHGIPGKWGSGQGAGSVSGAPYHMRAKDFDGGGGKNQDRSIQNGALCLPPQATFGCASSVLTCPHASSTCTADDLSGNSYTWTITGATITSGQGTTTIHYTATGSGWVHITLVACDTTQGCPGDFCCNEYTDSVQVLADTTPPSITCPGAISVQCLSNVPAPDTNSVIVSDNCGTAARAFVSDSSNGQTCPKIIYRKYKATDGSGNVSFCTQIITVNDTIKPSFTNCPSNITVQCSAIPAPASPTATDNCTASPIVTYLGQTTTPGACPQAYTLTRKWVAKDDCNNADTCTQVITVIDTTKPVFTNCPANVTVQCSSIPAPTSPNATDNCDASPIITYLGQTTTPGNCPQAYTLTRKWEAKDHCGNADTCTQVITVIDTTKPSFTNCPANVTVQCSSVPAPASPNATDNCDASPIITYLGQTTTPGNCPQAYTLTRKWEAKDHCGNADTCTQVITVVDTTKPTFTNCPTNATVQCNNIPAPASPNATDNCDTSPIVTYLGQTINPGNCPYTITRKWEAKDHCGNADTCTQTLTVIDNVKPSFVNCPPPITVQCDAVPAPASPTATDNCDPNPVVTYLGQTTTPGNCPQSYTLTRKWEAKDVCGNADTCTQVITVIDNVKPVFTNCPSNITVQCNAVPNPANPNATDNCDATPTVMYLGQTTTPGNCPQSYTLNRKWEAKDDCGNADTCKQTITVVDTSRPTFTNCPASVSVQCNNVPGPATPNATDNCDNSPTVTYLGEFLTPGNCPSQYTLRRKWEAKDHCNNADTCIQIITVTDTAHISLGPDRLIDAGFVCVPQSGCFNPPPFTGGCGPFNWTVNGVATRPDTNICYSVGFCTNFDQTWTFIASDGCGKADTAKVRVKATVNCPPTVQCPAGLGDIRICKLGDTVCIPGTGFGCTDIDNNVVSTTLNGVPYNPGDSFCFVPAAEGAQALRLVCTDACNKADTCFASFNVIVDRSVCPCPDITIEKIHHVIQGQYQNVSIFISNMSYPIGGFNLLIEYDPSAMSLSQVQEGGFITTCGWEYFTYRNGASGNCGTSACPSGKVRITAIAEINNGLNHPSCFLLEPGELAKLVFLISNDRTLECQFVRIRFCWYDCRDNTLSSVTGDTLYISSTVNEYVADGIYSDITDLTAPFPSRFGANATCDVDLNDGKPNPIRCIDFFNGGIDIVCSDSIDARGDINLNGVPNEVSDAVLLSNYFIYGIGVFTVNVQGQIAASDVNADGTVLSVADLVYLIRVVIGDALPYSKITTPVNINYTHSRDGRLTVDGKSAIGAAAIIVQGEVTPSLLASQMEMKYNFDGTNTRILVWSVGGNSFTGDFLQTSGEITSIEMATAEGGPVALNVLPTEFELHQNYPNPFNPKTVISFTLPVASDYELSIYNVNGQQVASFTGSAKNAGTFEITWDAGNFASGIYFYKLHAGMYHDIKKMILLK